tara:strand:- start:37 stop:732 length:696 start_codon:yes stop_codon:yes gene_type:complete
MLTSKLMGAGGAGGDAAPTKTLEANASYTDTGKLTVTGAGLVYTYASCPIGTASADRVLVVLNGTRSRRTISGITVGGVAMAVQAVTVADARGYSHIATLLVTSGTTADIVVTYVARPDDGAMAIYSTTGMSATATATGNSSSDSTVASTTLNVLEGELLFAVSASDTQDIGITWAGVTEELQFDDTSGSRGQVGMGSEVISADETPRTVSATYLTVAELNGIAAATFSAV